MRSSVLTVFAGATAAFCFLSIHFGVLLGSLLFPICTLPLFLVLYLQPHREILLALAGAGITLGLCTLGGLIAAPLLHTFLMFTFMAALPAIFIGLIYTRPYKVDEEGDVVMWVPPEVPMISLCFLSLILFFTVLASAPWLFGQSLYETIYTFSFNYVEMMHTQLQEVAPEMIPEDYNAAQLAKVTTLNIAGLGIFMFISGHFINLIFAQWLLLRRDLIEQPLPNMANIYFPHQFIAFTGLTMGALVLGSYLGWGDKTLFALTAPLIAFTIPLMLQGLSTFHRNFVLRLVKAGRISVYLGLLIGLLAMPFQMCALAAILGFTNNLLVLIKNRKNGYRP